MANFIPPLIKRTSSAAVSRAIWRRPGIKLRGSSIGTRSRQTCAKEKEKEEEKCSAMRRQSAAASLHSTRPEGFYFQPAPVRAPRRLTISNTLFVLFFLCNSERKLHKLKGRKMCFVSVLKGGQRALMKVGMCAVSSSRSPFMSLITAMTWGDPSVKPPPAQIYTLQAC